MALIILNLIILWFTTAAMADEAELGVILTSKDGEVSDMVTSVFSQATRTFQSTNISLNIIQTTEYSSSPFAILSTVCSAAKQLSVAVTYLPCRHDKLLTSFLTESTIPHVAITPPCGEVMTPWTFRIQPHRKYIFDVLYDILTYEKIKLFILVHDDSTDSKALNKFLGRFSSSTTAASVLDVDKFTSDPLWPRLKAHLASRDVIAVIVLVLNCYNTIKTLSLAEKLQLTEGKLRWVIANDEVVHVAYITEVWKNGNIIFVQNQYTPRKISPCNSVVLNNTVFVWENKTVRLLEEQYLSDAILLVTEALDDLDGRDAVTPKNISCWTQSQLARKLLDPPEIDPIYSTIKEKIQGKDGYSTNMEYVVRGIDSNWLSGQMRAVTTATWTPAGGLELVRNEIFTETYNNFEGLPLKVTLSVSRPYVYLCDENEDDFKLCGLCVRILNEMAKILNFTVEPTFRKGPTGNMDENGNWNGMVGKIIDQEADIAAGPTSITSDRAQVVWFTTSYTEDPAAIIMRKARPSPILRVFTPLSLATWILVIVSIIFLPIMLHLVERYSPLRGGGPYSEERRPPPSLLDVMWQSYTTYSLQGGEYRHRSLSGRSLIVFYVLFSIVINSVYTAILTAILTVSTDYSPINNLKDLAASTQYTPLVLDGSNLKTLFKNSADGTTYGKIWQRLKDQTFPTTTLEAIDRMKHDEYLAFMSDRSVLQYLLTKPEYCHEFVLASEFFNPTGLAFMVPIGAPYRTQLSNVISYLQEGGFIEKWREELWQVNSECAASAGGSTGVTDIRSIMGCFVVLGGALASGLILLVFERLSWRIKPRVLSAAYSIKWAKPVGNWAKKRNTSESSMDCLSNVTGVTMAECGDGSSFNIKSIRSRKVTDVGCVTHM